MLAVNIRSLLDGRSRHVVHITFVLFLLSNAWDGMMGQNIISLAVCVCVCMGFGVEYLENG